MSTLCALLLLYAECENGKFGDNCVQVCGNCKEESCQHDVGWCLLGCKDGYQGTQCNSAFCHLSTCQLYTVYNVNILLNFTKTKHEAFLWNIVHNFRLCSL